jgi:hypothetical protein
MVLLGPALQEHLPHSEEHVLKGHEGPVLAVRFNTQGTYCLSCGKVRPARPRLPAHDRLGRAQPSLWRTCARASQAWLTAEGEL